MFGIAANTDREKAGRTRKDLQTLDRNRVEALAEIYCVYGRYLGAGHDSSVPDDRSLSGKEHLMWSHGLSIKHDIDGELQFAGGKAHLCDMAAGLAGCNVDLCFH